MEDDLEGQVVAGKYRLIRRLSGGGMGAVWLGHHLGLDAPIALKFMHPTLATDAGLRARFEREAKAAAQIRSPHVVHVYDHGVEDDRPFLVMELLEGRDLASRLAGGKTLAPAEAARICDEMCKGLARAHALGIIHRDLKPGNVFLSAPDDDMVKLLDFGIAKETASRRVVEGETTTGQLLGSPQYLSPEQARGMPVDARSDLWSVGVVLYRALLGARPFEAGDVGDLIVRICTEEPRRPTSLRPDLPPSVDDFFRRALDRDPAGRFASAKDLAAAFREALELAPVTGSRGGSAPTAGATAQAALGSFTPSAPSDPGDLGARPGGTIRDDTFSAMSIKARGRTRVLAGAVGLTIAAVAAVAIWARAPDPGAPRAAASGDLPVAGKGVSPEVTRELPDVAPSAPDVASVAAPEARATSNVSASARRAPARPPPRPVGSRPGGAAPPDLGY